MIVIYVRNGSIILSICIDNSFIGKLNEELLSKKDKATQNVLEKEKNRLIKKNEEMITEVYQQIFR